MKIVVKMVKKKTEGEVTKRLSIEVNMTDTARMGHLMSFAEQVTSGWKTNESGKCESKPMLLIPLAWELVKELAAPFLLTTPQPPSLSVITPAWMAA
jgi:hypothetical protein